jgi:hypothetical protein
MNEYLELATKLTAVSSTTLVFVWAIAGYFQRWHWHHELVAMRDELSKSQKLNEELRGEIKGLTEDLVGQYRDVVKELIVMRRDSPVRTRHAEG